MHEMTHYI